MLALLLYDCSVDALKFKKTMSSTSVVTITADNRGPIVNLASWILLTVMCLAAITKVSSKWLLINNLQPDDWYMITGMVQPRRPFCQYVGDNADQGKGHNSGL